MDLLRRRSILIADDNQDLAVSLSMLLKLVGFEVETVHTGGEAVTAAKLRRPDVLLLDIGLPGLDGYQVARQFRSDDNLKDVFIIAISGYSPDMFRERSTPAWACRPGPGLRLGSRRDATDCPRYRHMSGGM